MIRFPQRHTEPAGAPMGAPNYRDQIADTRSARTELVLSRRFERAVLRAASPISSQHSHRSLSSPLLDRLDIFYRYPLVVLHGLSEVALVFVEMLEVSIVKFARRLHAFRKS